MEEQVQARELILMASSELKKVASSMEREVIIYDLDEGKFLSKRTTEDLGLVPPTTASFLTGKVERLAKWTKGHSGFRRRFRSGASRLQAQSLLKEKLSVFLHFFVELMMKYHDFEAVKEDQPSFDVNAFVQSRPADIRLVIPLLYVTALSVCRSLSCVPSSSSSSCSPRCSRCSFSRKRTIATSSRRS